MPRAKRNGPRAIGPRAPKLAYSPPFASAMDTLNALGNTAGNILDGLYRRMTAGDALAALGDPASDVLFLHRIRDTLDEFKPRMLRSVASCCDSTRRTDTSWKGID